MNDGTWHHMAVTADFETLGTEDAVKIYVDGRLDADKSGWDINKPEVDHRIRIGHVHVQGGHFTGLIDEVRVYKRTLSAEEVAALYQAGASGSEGAAAGRAAGKQPADPAPGGQETAGAPRPDPALGRDSLRRLLAEIDSLIGRGDYAAARARVEKATTDAVLRGFADEIAAARGVCDSLAAWRKAVRGAVENHLDKEIELRTSKGKLMGKVQRITDEGIDLLVRKKLRGMDTVEMRLDVKWSDLTPEQEDDLARAGGWNPEGGADGAVVRAYVALAREDRAAAGRALAGAGDHSLAARVRRRLETPRRDGGKTETVAKPPPKEVTGLVGYWRFDEARGAKEAKDSSGAERHGALDSAILGMRGWRGRAVGFPANGGSVNIGAVDAEAKTLAFRVVFSKGVDTATKGSCILGCGKDAWIGVGDVSTGRRRSVSGEVLSVNCGGMTFTDQKLRENEWHHVAFRWSGEAYEIYINGGKIAARSTSWKGRATPAKLVRVTDLEAGSKDKPLPFDWLMDDLRVYDRALEPREIMALRAGRHIAK